MSSCWLRLSVYVLAALVAVGNLPVHAAYATDQPPPSSGVTITADYDSTAATNSIIPVKITVSGEANYLYVRHVRGQFSLLDQSRQPIPAEIGVTGPPGGNYPGPSCDRNSTKSSCSMLLGEWYPHDSFWGYARRGDYPFGDYAGYVTFNIQAPGTATQWVLNATVNLRIEIGQTQVSSEKGKVSVTVIDKSVIQQSASTTIKINVVEPQIPPPPNLSVKLEYPQRVGVGDWIKVNVTFNLPQQPLQQFTAYKIYVTLDNPVIMIFGPARAYPLGCTLINYPSTPVATTQGACGISFDHRIKGDIEHVIFYLKAPGQPTPLHFNATVKFYPRSTDFGVKSEIIQIYAGNPFEEYAFPAALIGSGIIAVGLIFGMYFFVFRKSRLGPSAYSKEVSSKFCASCGRRLSLDSLFCDRCAATQG